MTQAILHSLPVESRFIPSCLENIIDKKIQDVALNKLERLIHWICSWIYCPYQTLYQAKMARVHTFSDGAAKLFDATTQGIVKIDFEWDTDFIAINHKKVLFNPKHNMEVRFSRKADTDFVVVRDDAKRRAGWFEVSEQEISRPGNAKPMAKTWVVDTNQIIPFGKQSAYLAKNCE